MFLLGRNEVDAVKEPIRVLHDLVLVICSMEHGTEGGPVVGYLKEGCYYSLLSE